MARRLGRAIHRRPGESSQPRDGSPTSLTRLSSQPFWVTKARPGRADRHPATHLYGPVKFTPCADASVAIAAADTAIALRTILIAFSLITESSRPSIADRRRAFRCNACAPLHFWAQDAAFRFQQQGFQQQGGWWASESFD